MKNLFSKSQTGQKGFSLPKDHDSFKNFTPPQHLKRKTPLELPEISELDLTRHFSQLAHRNRGIDTHFYPLGSCTMKFNPRVNEWAASLTQMTRCHPLAPSQFVQGNLEIIDHLLHLLCETSGMDGGTLTCNGGAQGEFIGLRLIAAYHHAQGDDQRKEILIPDNAHGTNPASATLAGYHTITLKTNPQGDVDLEHLRQLVSPRCAGLMLTNPNTLGLFSLSILEIASIIHKAGGLLYYDGANLNPLLEIVRPGDMGFDVMHINLHKTFSTPHGGGGPGAGPVLCKERLKPFLPVPRVVKEKGQYHTIWQDPKSIGSIATFYGNFAICLRAYLYILLHGRFGLRRIAENAVLNANYLKHHLKDLFTDPYPQYCMHEFVLQADNYTSQGIRALDIAKRLLDYGVYAPTIYFPLIVKECLLIEPTESESKATLDRFIEILQHIVNEIEKHPEVVKTAPHTTPSSRLDETLAAKKPKLIWSS